MVEVKDEDLVQVQNLVDHTVVFKDEDTHRRIVFNAYEPKKLTAGILRRLYYSHGGEILLRNYLSVKNAELAKEFGVSEDTIEYNWTQKDVDAVLTTGSLDELKDALDFGPDGIKDLIVDRAIALRIDNVSKRQAIKEKTGSDITTMIDLKDKVEAVEAAPEAAPEVTTRRAAKKVADAPTGRRVEK